MRRAKSNPAKYARNYQKISSRRMTNDNNDDDDKKSSHQMKELRNKIQSSSKQLQSQSSQKNDQTTTSKQNNNINVIGNLHDCIMEDATSDAPQYTTDATDLILPSKSRKRKKDAATKRIELASMLTAEELKAAKAKHKAMQRKLKQLEMKSERKKRRTESYNLISKHAISDAELNLMEKSSNLGKRVSKKEQLKKLLQRERAGMDLNEVERALLYTKVQVNPYESDLDDDESMDGKEDTMNKNESGHQKASNHYKNSEDNSTNSEGNNTTINQSTESSINNSPPTDPSQLAALMMSGISALKTKATEAKELADKDAASKKQEEEEYQSEKAPYVAEKTVVVKSAGPLDSTPNKNNMKTNWRVLPVERPDEINKKRYDLPISSMEYEIIDSVRNHAVTVLCSETGSGKSTQVPQFLYESGVTLGNASREGQDDGLLIGITQPRRVAAISTAKRVCYEMGHSADHGQSIRGGAKGEGNLVSYNTKYESAGSGEKTRIRFMTDGVLLQEVKSDLLLRKYAVVCIDEAHERNLNTDVLLGLLSAAVTLRQKAVAEGSLPPLKIVIMSATLRVDDFISNDRLFKDSKPNLVSIPGRTFPVTIHHSKVTEFDDYAGVAFQKVCKIHRKLPRGGILVFLTGKQEIVTMVKRLQKSLMSSERKKKKGNPTSSDLNGDLDVNQSQSSQHGHDEIRDMDDDEVDSEYFHDINDDQVKDNFDDEVIDSDDSDDGMDEVVALSTTEEKDSIPKKVIILPLYSLLSVQDQARVFAPIPDDTRLIVVSTNIAETSLTIPGISYVVDTGRQKCKNYHAATGVSSYDVMWISKAAADQRAGRSGRTAAGHCYRIYSSSVYLRQFDPFPLPEILTRPLEDVVLTMKAMKIPHVTDFPFPTSPDSIQLNASIKLLAQIGCLDISNRGRKSRGDGEITMIGRSVSTLPLGVRYAKMLLMSAKEDILDYGIIVVSILSESSIFERAGQITTEDKDEATNSSEEEDLDEVDRSAILLQEKEKRKNANRRKRHEYGDILAALSMVGAYSYEVEKSGTGKNFCEEQGLNIVVMEILKMRKHVTRLVHQRLDHAKGIAAKSGGINYTMSPPNKLQEEKLRKVIACGLLDNVARLAPMGYFNVENSPFIRTGYVSCRSDIKEPLYIETNSVLFSKDSRQLPEWVCYDTLMRKATKDGSTMTTMRGVTSIEESWLSKISEGSQLLSLGEPLVLPSPTYCTSQDAILCSVSTKYGDHGWIIHPPLQFPFMTACQNYPNSKAITSYDSYRWFARLLLEGKIIKELKGLPVMLNEHPNIFTKKKPLSKVAIFLSSLSDNKIDSVETLTRYWAEKDQKFLYKQLKSWIKKQDVSQAKKLWIDTVKTRVQGYYR